MRKFKPVVALTLVAVLLGVGLANYVSLAHDWPPDPLFVRNAEPGPVLIKDVLDFLVIVDAHPHRRSTG
ncbi:hypothetical protein AB3X96_15585 [Paraburkholderia sp. BR13439]|uniref:Uncharacterized protein n=1 Tax=Paraburkholderia youngii TaxID=2782701 RepID=A0A7Y6JTR6_9BURK|nr:hypothetical protein [Paraburkholderia youngii]NUX98506.1 hypothetical protein [Paraburkholderia youngii]NVH76668.1 hypothetical protein [Paraburkholderia youngii]